MIGSVSSNKKKDMFLLRTKVHHRYLYLLARTELTSIDFSHNYRQAAGIPDGVPMFYECSEEQCYAALLWLSLQE